MSVSLTPSVLPNGLTLCDPVCGSNAFPVQLATLSAKMYELPLRTLLALPAAGMTLSLPVALPRQMQVEQSEAPGLKGIMVSVHI